MKKHPLRVLLIDDDEDIYKLARHFLSSVGAEKVELEWSPEYEPARQALAQCKHDVYLIDYNLGDRNGLELLREAVRNGCKAPMVLLTGQGSRDLDVEAMNAGASDYLDKTRLSAPLLERSIRYAVERKRVEATLRQLEIVQERQKTAQKMLLILMHEIFNPLTGILGNVALLKGEDLPPQAKACLKDIEECAHRIQSALQELRKLDLANPTIITGRD